MDNSQEYKIAELLTRLFEGAADDNETAYLKEWLSKDEGALEYYWDFVKDYTALKTKYESDINSESKSFSPDFYDQEIWAALAEVEKNAIDF